jgi:ribosomal protein S18 acetylase RimI-like enzyme
VALVLRAIRADERDFFFAVRRGAFRAYSEAAFGSWNDVEQRGFADRDVDELPFEIVERDGTPIGYQLVERHSDHWFLDEIALAEGERGHGIGTELVTAIMTAARDAGMPLRLSVLEVNPAQRLYARLGFRVTRVEPPRIKLEWP